MFFIAIEAISETNVVIRVDADEDVLGASSERVGSDGYINVSSDNGITYSLEKPNEKDINNAKILYEQKVQQEKIEEEKRKALEEVNRIKNEKIQAIKSFLASQNSPMEPYAENVYQVCKNYSDHYCKFFLSISGVESGFGRVCVGYSAWGMIGITYSSWPEAISQASQWIATNYYYNGSDSFEELAYSSYGPQNPELWIQHLYFYYNQIQF